MRSRLAGAGVATKDECKTARAFGVLEAVRKNHAD
jgi:hypothetical protein